MELTGILFLVVILVAFILFVFGLVKGFPGWGVWYTITLSFLFLFSLGFLFASAVVAQRRIGWVRIEFLAKKKLASLEKEVQQLKFGSRDQTTSDLNSLLGLASELSRIAIERGSVWRNTEYIDSGKKLDTIKLKLSPPVPNPTLPPDVPVDKPEAVVNGDLPVETLVYAFGEGAGSDSTIVPKFYLGEYFVAESQGGTATLRPVAPLLPVQVQAITSGEYPRWTIFKNMPIDSHVVFAEVGSKQTNEAEFGHMDRKVLAELLQIPEELLDRDPSQLNADEARQRRLLNSYVLDGGRAPENEAPENVWNRVEFLVDHTIEVDANEEKGRKATDGGYFDFSGRAVDARLKQKDGEGKVNFKKGQQAIFASAPSKQLIDDKVVKLIEPIFVRRINDYTFGFKEIRDRITQTIQDTELIQREIDKTKATTDRVQQQVVFRQSERQLLDKDRTQYEKELAVIKAEVGRIDQLVKDTSSELSRLYRQTLQSYERLIQTQKALYSAATGSR
jgi:hypothetical protein